MKPNNENLFELLPDDVIKEILKNISPKELLSIRLTNRSFFNNTIEMVRILHDLRIKIKKISDQAENIELQQFEQDYCADYTEEKRQKKINEHKEEIKAEITIYKNFYKEALELFLLDNRPQKRETCCKSLINTAYKKKTVLGVYCFSPLLAMSASILCLINGIKSNNTTEKYLSYGISAILTTAVVSIGCCIYNSISKDDAQGIAHAKTTLENIANNKKNHIRPIEIKAICELLNEILLSKDSQHNDSRIQLIANNDSSSNRLINNLEQIIENIANTNPVTVTNIYSANEPTATLLHNKDL